MSAPARKLVAIVDDDPRILESLQDLLESAGYDVRRYPSAAAFLADGVADIDCLITDVGLPGMDGFELRARVRQLRPQLSVFLISGRRDLTDADARGGAEFFSKPFDGPALLRAVASALDDCKS